MGFTPTSVGAGGEWKARARAWRVGGAALLLLCIVLYLPGLWSIPPVDRDECRFAQASRQMFEAAVWPIERQDRRMSETGVPVGRHAGGWVVPMVAQKPRLNKPPLIYWLQVASAWVFTGGVPERDAMWMYRLPSALCALGTVLITWRLGGRLFDARAAWLGAGLLAVSPMIVWDAHQARADSLLMLCTTAAMAGVWGVLQRPTLRRAVVMWLCVGAGVLAKGFITPLVVVSAIVALCVARRSWVPLRSARPLLGVVVIGVCVAPWVWALGERVGLAVYWREVWSEVFLRAATGAKDGGRVFLPPGLHVLLSGLLLWPATLLLLPAVVGAVDRAWGRTLTPSAGGSVWSRGWARLRGMLAPARGRSAELFLLAWVVPAWIVFEFSPAKLPHYPMPLYPALALLAGRALLAAQARLRVPGRVGAWGWFAVGVLPPLAVAGLVWISDVAPEARVSAVVFVIGLIFLPVAGVMLVGMQFLRGLRWAGASLAGVCAAAWMLPLTLHAVAPALIRQEKPKLLTGNVTERLFSVVRSIEDYAARPIASVYHEDSVVFQSRGYVQKIRQADQAAWLAANPAGIMIADAQIDGLGRDAWVMGRYAVLAPVRMGDGRLTPAPSVPQVAEVKH